MNKTKDAIKSLDVLESMLLCEKVVHPKDKEHEKDYVCPVENKALHHLYKIRRHIEKERTVMHEFGDYKIILEKN